MLEMRTILLLTSSKTSSINTCSRYSTKYLCQTLIVLQGFVSELCRLGVTLLAFDL